MSQSQLYQAQLDEALTKRAMVLAKEEIPALKNAFRTYQSAYSGIYKVFLEKALIQEDQYHYEQKISDLKPPQSDPFTESEMFDQMSLRLSNFLALLDFLNNFFFISPETLNLKTIKNALALVEYIHWRDLSITSSHLMTRNISLYLEKIKQSGDSMALNIISNSVKVLTDQLGLIKTLLKKASIYARLHYKLTARINVLSQITLDPKRIQNDRKGTLQAIKFEFPLKWQDAPFYRELIEEILEEDYGSDSEILQSKALKLLETKEKTVKKKKRNLDMELKQDLLNHVLEMAKAHMPLETIITRMNENSRLMDENPASFSEKLSRWFNRVMLRKMEVFYDIQVTQSGTGSKREKLNFTTYINWLRMKASFYKSLKNPNSQSYIRATESSNEELEEFLAKNQQELKRILNKATTLDTFFKGTAEGDLKKKVKGYKAELTQLKGIISNIITGLKEYQARKEEMEQLRKLGIDPNAD